MAASIHDVAKRAGVSIATVSRIINSSATVSDKKAAAVREAMEYFNYEPNQFGRGLVKQTSHMIGVYFPHSTGSIFDSDYNLELLKGMEQVLSRHNYSLVLISENDEYEKKKMAKPKFLEYVSQKRVDGLLISGLTPKSAAEEAFKQLLEEEYPMIYIGKRFHKKGYNVYAQYEVYMYKMVETLYQKNHRDILIHIWYMHKELFKNVASRIKEHMPEVRIQLIISDSTGASDRKYWVENLKKYVQEEKYTAVCISGMESIGILLSACAELELQVPDDLSVIAVEHKKGQGQRSYPAIDAFYVPVFEMGAGAADLLIGCVEGQEILDHSMEFETVYIERESIKDRN